MRLVIFLVIWTTVAIFGGMLVGSVIRHGHDGEPTMVGDLHPLVPLEMTPERKALIDGHLHGHGRDLDR